MNLELRKTHAEVQAIIADRQPLEVEALVSSDKRRTITIAEFQAWRESLAPKPEPEGDEL